MSTLAEYRETLQRIGAGTVSVDFALSVIQAAEREIATAAAEYTLTQAVARSGRSRGYFEARLARLVELGLARKPGRDWLLKAAAIPSRESAVRGPVDEGLGADEIADLVLGRVA